jgi:hypothetical protein
MGNPTMNQEFPKRDQRFAVCNQIWRDKDKKDSAPGGEDVSKEAMREVPLRALCLALPPEAVKLSEAEGKARMHLVAVSGKPFENFWWGTIAFDLKGMSPAKKRIPALEEHNRSARVGWLDTFSTSDEGWVAEGPFLSNPTAKQIQQDSSEGFPWQASTFWNPLRIEEIAEGASAEANGQTIAGPANIVRECKVYEVSWCALGADSETSGSVMAAGDGAVSIPETVFYGGEPMAEEKVVEPAAPPEPVIDVAAACAAAVQKARDEDKARMMALLIAANKDAAVALDAYFDGKDVIALKLELADKALTELAKVKAENATLKDQMHDGPTGVQFSASDVDGKVLTVASDAGLSPAERDKKRKGEFAASAEIRDVYRTEGAYLSYMKAQDEGKIHVAVRRNLAS